MPFRGRQSFKDYSYMRRAIESLKNEDCTVSDVVRGSSVEAPYTQHSIRVRGVDRYKMLLNTDRINQYKAECSKVEKLIDNAPTKMREMLTMRYINNARLEDVASRFGYATPDSAFQAFNRWFNKNGM